MPSMTANATHEKCTCDLVMDSNILDNGASVRNATACWSTEDIDHKWCDISVQAIEGDTRHQTVISELINLKADPEALTAYLQSQAESASQTAEPVFAEAPKQLPVLMSQFNKLTSSCVEGFINYMKDKVPFDGIEESPFKCRVGETTGWLRMSFQVGDVRFVYLVAPDA
jgi:hypothetical protein